MDAPELYFKKMHSEDCARVQRSNALSVRVQKRDIYKERAHKILNRDYNKQSPAAPGVCCSMMIICNVLQVSVFMKCD